MKRKILLLAGAVYALAASATLYAVSRDEARGEKTPAVALSQEQVQEKQKPTSRPMKKAELGNEICPVTGEKARPDHFLFYRDAEKMVFARIYTATAEAAKKLGESSQAEQKKAYEAAYLKRKDPKTGKDWTFPYGKTYMQVTNTVCPTTGDPASPLKNFSFNFNAISFQMCCLSCPAEFLSDPDKYLHNLNAQIDEAIETLKKTGYK